MVHQSAPQGPKNATEPTKEPAELDAELAPETAVKLVAKSKPAARRHDIETEWL